MKIKSISGGEFSLDGGTMFGVVPKVLWGKLYPADDLNRIRMDTNCILVQASQATVLIDSGFGTKTSAKQRHRMAMTDGNPLLDNLAKAGVAPEDIDFVILTHLHFDHVGGCTYLDPDGRLRASFPNAKHIVQRAEWQDATSNLPELRGAYSARELRALAEEAAIEIVDGHQQITEGVSVQLTGGHTRGHQVVCLDSKDEQAVYISELCPTTAHLRIFWTMAYDQELLQVRRAKTSLLNESAKRRQLVLFNHDPNVVAARLRRESDIQYAVDETVVL